MEHQIGNKFCGVIGAVIGFIEGILQINTDVQLWEYIIQLAKVGMTALVGGAMGALGGWAIKLFIKWFNKTFKKAK